SYLVLKSRTNLFFSLLYFSFPSKRSPKSRPPATRRRLSRRTTSSGSMGATSSKCSDSSLLRAPHVAAPQRQLPTSRGSDHGQEAIPEALTESVSPHSQTH